MNPRPSSKARISNARTNKARTTELARRTQLKEALEP